MACRGRGVDSPCFPGKNLSALRDRCPHSWSRLWQGHIQGGTGEGRGHQSWLSALCAQRCECRRRLARVGLQCVLPGDTSEPLGPAGVRVLQPLGMCLKSCRQPGREGHGGAGPAGGGVAAPQTTGGQRPWHRAAPGWAPTRRPWPTMALAPPPPSGRKPGCWQRGQPSGTRKGPAAMSPSSPRGSALFTPTTPEESCCEKSGQEPGGRLPAPLLPVAPEARGKMQSDIWGAPGGPCS